MRFHYESMKLFSGWHNTEIFAVPTVTTDEFMSPYLVVGSESSRAVF